MAHLSIIIIIAKNEEDRIETALKSAAWTDEIIVYDSGSTDKTIEISRSYAAKVFASEDWQGFGIQRQRAQNKATGDWILMFDADEYICETLQKEIQQIIQQDDRGYAYEIPRKSYVLGKPLNHCWYPDYVLRLYPKNKGKYNSMLLHERVELADNMQIKKLKSHLDHYSIRNIRHFLEKIHSYAGYWAKEQQNSKKRVTILTAVWHSVACFLKNYFIKRAFLDGSVGFLISILDGYSTFIKYILLWEKQQSL